MTGDVLITAAFSAPLVGVDPDDDEALHAVVMEAVVKGWGGEWVASACGLDYLKLVGHEGRCVPWPPRVAGLAPRHSRCRACHNLTGRKTPRSRLVAARSFDG